MLIAFSPIRRPLLWGLFLLPGLALAGATASKFKPESRLGANYWNAQAAIDGKLDTAWMVPGDSPNLGEWIAIDVPKATVDKIAIVPGWAKDEETFTDYPRVKKLRVEVLCCTGPDPMTPVSTFEIDVADKNELQIIDFADVKLGNELFGGSVKLSVVEIYEGEDFPNLAISELTIILKEFDANGVKPVATSSAADKTEDLMTDGNVKTFWAGQGPFSVNTLGFGVSSIEITPGPKDYARPKKVKVTANSRSVVTELHDTAGPASAAVPSITGYTGSAWGKLQVEILETYPGTNPEVGIAEFKVKATAFDG